MFHIVGTAKSVGNRQRRWLKGSQWYDPFHQLCTNDVGLPLNALNMIAYAHATRNDNLLKDACRLMTVVKHHRAPNPMNSAWLFARVAAGL
jgi:hypothetical protein